MRQLSTFSDQLLLTTTLLADYIFAVFELVSYRYLVGNCIFKWYDSRGELSTRRRNQKREIGLILAYDQRPGKEKVTDQLVLLWRRRKRASGHFCRKIMALEGNEWSGPSNKHKDHHQIVAPKMPTPDPQKIVYLYMYLQISISNSIRHFPLINHQLYQIPTQYLGYELYHKYIDSTQPTSLITSSIDYI